MLLKLQVDKANTFAMPAPRCSGRPRGGGGLRARIAAQGKPFARARLAPPGKGRGRCLTRRFASAAPTGARPFRCPAPAGRSWPWSGVGGRSGGVGPAAAAAAATTWAGGGGCAVPLPRERSPEERAAAHLAGQEEEGSSVGVCPAGLGGPAAEATR